MAKMITLVAGKAKAGAIKAQAMEYRYQVFCVNVHGVVGRINSFSTETDAEKYIASYTDGSNFRIVDMNGIIDAW